MVETTEEPEELTLGDLGLSLGESLAPGMEPVSMISRFVARVAKNIENESAHNLTVASV
jgi:hypothetical protein